MTAPGLQPQEIEELAELTGLLEDWLLHADPETLDDLTSFLAHTPCDRGRWITDSLATATTRLRRLHQELTP